MITAREIRHSHGCIVSWPIIFHYIFVKVQINMKKNYTSTTHPIVSDHLFLLYTPFSFYILFSSWLTSQPPFAVIDTLYMHFSHLLGVEALVPSELKAKDTITS